MKTMNMISRRSFLKAAMAASAVSALALPGCGGAASSAAVAAPPQQNIKKRPPCGLFFITFFR